MKWTKLVEVKGKTSMHNKPELVLEYHTISKQIMQHRIRTRINYPPPKGSGFVTNSCECLQ